MISKHLFVLLACLFVVMIGQGITMPVIARQNSIGLKAIDYSVGSLHTPTHDRGNAMAGNFDYGSS